MEYLLYEDQENKFNISEYKPEIILFALIDRWSYINMFDDRVEWRKKGQRHRNYNLPAIIFKIQTYSETVAKYVYYFEFCKDGQTINFKGR